MKAKPFSFSWSKTRHILAVLFGLTITLYLMLAFPFCGQHCPLLDQLTNDLFTMEATSCRFIHPAGLNLFGMLYALLLVPAVGFNIFKHFVRDNKFDLCRFLKHFTAAIIVLLAVLQLKTQFRQFLFEYIHVARKPLSEKQALLLPETARCAQFCRTVAGNATSGRLIMDFDKTTTPGIFYYVELGYLLYPLDILTSHSQPDVLVIYQKENPQQSVLPGYHLHWLTDQQCGCAVKGKAS